MSRPGGMYAPVHGAKPVTAALEGDLTAGIALGRISTCKSARLGLSASLPAGRNGP